MGAPVLRFKRGQFANLPGLQAGEPGFTTDRFDLFIGINSTTGGNKFFGSHRYWNKETTTTGSGVRLVEGSNNGDHFIELKSPDSLSGVTTYTFPATAVNGGYLTVDGSGTLSWDTTLDATTVNATGVGTVSFLQASTVNATGVITASQFSGSGAGLSAGTVPISALDIDGGTAATAVTADDLLIIDDGANGTNKKVTAQILSNFILGGAGGATFPSINVTGIGTVAQLNATTSVVGAGLTVTGATDLNGGLDVSGGETVLSSATVSDLTSGRVVLAGTSGALQDSANLTFGNNGLRITGDENISGILTASSFSGALTGNVTGNVTGNINSTGVSTVAFLQATTVNVSAAATIPTLSGTTATFTRVTANGGFTGNINATGVSTAAFLQATTVNATGIITASQFSGSGAGLSAGTTPISTLDIDGAVDIGADLADADLMIVDDGAGGTNRKAAMSRVKSYVLGGGTGANFASINVTGIGTVAQLKATTATVGAGLTVTGQIAGSGGASITGGETTLSSATVSDLTSGRVVLAGTSGALEDSANLTFNGSTLTTLNATVNGGISGNINASGVSTAAFLQATNVNASGIVTAAQFRTGATGSAIGITTNTINGPATITIDPAGVGDNTGTVVIAGNLQVDGTTTTINSTTVTVDDKNIVLADGAINDAAADGGGITVTSGEGNKTFQFEATGDNFGSSENLNLASGKVFKINNTQVLSSSALASSIVVDLASLDIDGGTALSGSLADADLFIVDDGATGTNRKATASTIKDYVLGGGTGANFSAINVSGISTVTFAKATTLTVGAGATISGLITGSAGATITGGETTLSSATVSDLTSGRIVVAGTSGALQDDAGLTYDVNSNALTVDGGIKATGVGTFSDVRNSSGGLLSLVGVSSVTAHAGLVTSFKFRGTGLQNFIVSNGVADIVLTGTAATTFTTSETFTATSGQTSFTFAANYTEGFLDVYQNGVRLISGTDYTAQDPTNGTFTLTSGAALNDQIEAVAWKSLGDIVNINTVKVINNLTVSGVATVNGSINGALNFTGVSTVGQLRATTVNATGIITASSFSGSGAGLSAGTIPITALDIDGGTALTGSLADADLFIVDDGAGGTNVKATALNIKDYVLGGGTGANFSAINVTGISTVTFAKATTLTVGAGATVSGLITGSAGATITGGETTLSSATVSDLTSGRVVLAGTSGALQDSSNLTFNGSALSVTGSATISNGFTVSAGEATFASATVSDLTSGRVVLAGASGALSDSANLTFGSNGLTVTGGSIVSAASTFSNNLNVGGNVVITGDLTVNGTTTQLNTTNTTVEDVLLELQVVDGGSLGSDTNKDVGIVMNYFDSSAKKAAIFWDDSAARMVMASVATESSGVITTTTFSGLEIGSLFLNDCAGASQVISCSGTTRSLDNITIDCGTF